MGYCPQASQGNDVVQEDPGVAGEGHEVTPEVL